METFCHSTTKRGEYIWRDDGMSWHIGFVIELPKGEFVSSCVG
jgi:hypothetical protein